MAMPDIPDAAIIDFIAFIVGDVQSLGPDGQDWQRVTAVRSLLRRYGKLPTLDMPDWRTADTPQAAAERARFEKEQGQ